MNRNNDQFVRATQHLVSIVEPGCFAQISKKLDENLWVEIEGVEGELLIGKVHYELSSPGDSAVSHENGEKIRFRRDDITHLGCGRYCFC